MKTCRIDGCEGTVKARGLCDKHYLKARRDGRLDLFDGPGRGKYAPETSRTCPGVSECGKDHFARGLCSSCYQMRKKTGALQSLPKINAGRQCSVGGCGHDAKSSGFCGPHYERLKKYGDPLASAPKKTGGPCSTPGCSGLVRAKGLCFNCYTRVKNRGSVEYSARHLKRFEERLDDKGYVLVPMKGEMATRANGTRAAKHRVVMSEFLGRPLRDDENVHHINGDRSDNAIENLELWVSTQPSGQRPLDLLTWAKEIVKRYGKEQSKLKTLRYRESTAPPLI